MDCERNCLSMMSSAKFMYTLWASWGTMHFSIHLILGVFGRPHYVLRESKSLCATQAPPAWYFTSMLRKHKVFVCKNHEVPIGWLRSLMWHMCNRSRSFTIDPYRKWQTIANHTIVVVCVSKYTHGTIHCMPRGASQKVEMNCVSSTDQNFQVGPPVGTPEITFFYLLW